MDKRLEKDVRDIVKKIIDKEISFLKKELDKQMSVSIKKLEDSKKDKFLTKEEIKELLIKAFVRQNKFMWEKSKFVTSYFKEL